MKYRIICAIDLEAKIREEAENIVAQQLKGKASLYIDYIEELDENEWGGGS